MPVLARSAWTTTANNAVAIRYAQRWIYIHYPGQKAAIGRASQASIAARLRAYRRMHVAGEYSEIAYNWAVDQQGRKWELRGWRQAGGNGGTWSNRQGQAILVLVGNTEHPTAECLQGIRELVAMIRSRDSRADDIDGHRESPDAATACPGDVMMSYIISDALEPGAIIPPSVGPSQPTPGHGGMPWRTSPRVAGFTRAEVRAIQHVLLGFDISVGSYGVDGSYGDDTGTAVRELQRELEVTADGIYGPSTERAVVTIRSDITEIKRNVSHINRGGKVSLRQEVADSKSMLLELPETVTNAVWGIGGGANAPMINRIFEGGKEYPVTTLSALTDRIVRQQIIPLRAEVAGLSKALDQLSIGQGVDPEVVQKAVTDAIAAGFAAAGQSLED